MRFLNGCYSKMATYSTLRRSRRSRHNKRTRCCRMSNKEIRITKADGTLIVRDGIQPSRWQTRISKSLIYISKDNNSSYWLLEKVRPKIHFVDRTQTIHIASNRLLIKSPTTYNRIKELLND